jgi:hypothetical protein
MKLKKPHWGVLAVVTFIVLLLAGSFLPPLPGTQARASRISGVNNVSSFFATSTK